MARAHRIDLDRPFDALPAKQRELLLTGAGARDEYKVKIDKFVPDTGEVLHMLESAKYDADNAQDSASEASNQAECALDNINNAIKALGGDA